MSYSLGDLVKYKNANGKVVVGKLSVCFNGSDHYVVDPFDGRLLPKRLTHKEILGVTPSLTEMEFKAKRMDRI